MDKFEDEFCSQTFRFQVMSPHWSFVMRMVRIIFTIMAWCWSFSEQLVAQNLVLNSGFEMVDSCPATAGQIYLASPWQAENLTPDLYHRCAINTALRPPYLEVFCTYLQPHQGDGFAGLVAYGPVREYLKAPLSTPLIKGQLYFIRFWVAIDDNCIVGIPKVFSDGIGIAFGSSSTIREVAVNNTTGILSDTSGWVEITGCYTAEGGESHLYVGNFRNNGETQIEVDTTGSVFEDYLYVDDIEVVPFDPLPDTTWLCDSPLAMQVDFDRYPIRWNENDYSPKIQIDSVGFIQVFAETEHCLLRDQSEVIDGIPTSLTDIVPWCPESTVSLKAPVPGSYRWNDGSKGILFSVKQAGSYPLQLTNGCGTWNITYEVTSQNCDCNVFIPNVFSPNGDGVNDELSIFIDCPSNHTNAVLQIYDRWGQLIYSTSDPISRPWTGSVPPGTYIYRLVYQLEGDTKLHSKTGDITVIK